MKKKTLGLILVIIPILVCLVVIIYVFPVSRMGLRVALEGLGVGVIGTALIIMFIKGLEILRR